MAKKEGIILVNDNCIKAHKCPVIKSCPVGAITHTDIKKLPIVDSSKCILCEKCVNLCHQKAFEFKKVNNEETN